MIIIEFQRMIGRNIVVFPMAHLYFRADEYGHISRQVHGEVRPTGPRESGCASTEYAQAECLEQARGLLLQIIERVRTVYISQ
ncbi:MAG: hypothetical protein CMN26_05830 [Salinisphaera sp.]|nr:hypothetical protein [Salinisphaera sp.]